MKWSFWPWKIAFMKFGRDAGSSLTILESLLRYCPFLLYDILKNGRLFGPTCFGIAVELKFISCCLGDWLVVCAGAAVDSPWSSESKPGVIRPLSSISMIWFCLAYLGVILNLDASFDYVSGACLNSETPIDLCFCENILICWVASPAYCTLLFICCERPPNRVGSAALSMLSSRRKSALVGERLDWLSMSLILLIISVSLSVFLSNRDSLFRLVLYKVDASSFKFPALGVKFSGLWVFSYSLFISTAVFILPTWIFWTGTFFSYRALILFSSSAVSFWNYRSNNSFYFLRYSSFSLCWFRKSTKKDGLAMQFTSLFITCFFRFGRFMFFLFRLSNRSSMKIMVAFTLSTIELFSSLFIFPPLAPRLCTKSSRSILVLKDGFSLMISLIFWYCVWLLLSLKFVIISFSSSHCLKSTLRWASCSFATSSSSNTLFFSSFHLRAMASSFLCWKMIRSKFCFLTFSLTRSKLSGKRESWMACFSCSWSGLIGYSVFLFFLKIERVAWLSEVMGSLSILLLKGEKTWPLSIRLSSSRASKSFPSLLDFVTICNFWAFFCGLIDNYVFLERPWLYRLASSGKWRYCRFDKSPAASTVCPNPCRVFVANEGPCSESCPWSRFCKVWNSMLLARTLVFLVLACLVLTKDPPSRLSR